MAKNHRFANKSKKLISTCATTIIAKEAEFNGDLNIECKLHVDGTFKGKITSSSAIVIAKSGKFEGKISDAYKVIVSGELIGDVITHELEILKGGIFKGDITTSNLTIEPGALLEGEVAKQKETNTKEKDTKNNAKTKDKN